MLGKVFLIAILQPWFTNALSRMVKTPKLHFLDSGLLATVRGLTFDRMRADRNTFGAVLESFVFSEILKLMAAADMRLSAYHYRDRDTREVDIVLERDDGRIVGIEVKASATVKASDFGGLRALAEVSGDRFAFGAVLMTIRTSCRSATGWLPRRCRRYGNRYSGLCGASGPQMRNRYCLGEVPAIGDRFSQERREGLRKIVVDALYVPAAFTSFVTSS